MNDRRVPRRVIVIVAASLLWAALLAADLAPQLRGDYGWRWPYAAPREPLRLLPFVAGVCVYVLGARLFWERERATRVLGWAVVGGVALALTGLYVAFDPFSQLYSITVGAAASPWHYAAGHVTDLAATLRTWPAYMAEAARTISSHLGIAPPGAVVAYSLVNQFLARFPLAANALGRPLRAWQCDQFRLLDYTNAQFASAWLGILTPLWASLTVLPMYVLGRRVYGETAARWSVVWWPLVPGFLMFTPTPYTLYPLFSVAIIGLLIEGLRRDRPGWLFVSGLIASAMTFTSFAFAPLLFMAGLLAMGVYWRRTLPRPWHWPLQMGMWFGMGLSVVWIVFYAFTGVTVWAILREASGAHLALARPYWPWLVLHLNDFFMFTGWPLALLAGIGVRRTLRSLRAREGLSPGDLLTLAAACTLAALILAGTLRGESGRILLYLAPFLLFIAADALKTDGPRAGWMITVTQAGMAVVMVMFLRVLGAEFNTPPPGAPPPVPPPPVRGTASGAVFAHQLQLESFAGRYVTQSGAAGQAYSVVELWLDWRSAGQVDVPYYLSLIPVAPDGQAALAAELKQPFDGQYPTTCWFSSSGAIRLRTEARVFPSRSSGDWWVSLALVDARTGSKTEVGLPDGAVDDQVGLGPFPQP